MTTFLITFVVMILVALGMSVGVMAGRRELKGSCGGLGSADGSCPCGAPQQCDNKTAESNSAS